MKFFTILINMVVFLLSLLSVSSFAEVDYSSSAHGDPEVGVSRLDFPPYKTGNCAHCHEQHASIDGESSPVNKWLLFSSTASNIVNYTKESNFCFQCHSSSVVNNSDYSATFGSLVLAGDAVVANDNSGATNPTSILDAFNTTHSHNLNDIYNYAIENSTLFPSFKEGSNPCTACHDPHVARRNHANPTSATFSVMSLPNKHGELYGDDDGVGSGSVNERMSRWGLAPVYIAPYNEPDAVDTPDYNTFCLYCHSEAAKTSGDYPLHVGGVSGYVLPINWLDPLGNTGDGEQDGAYIVPGDKHGLNIATGNAAIVPPFGNTDDANLEKDIILSCLNCHEAHGSDNDYMHRRVINGTPLGVVISGVSAARGQHCVPCHEHDGRERSDGTLMWKNTHHGGGSTNDNPYSARKYSGCDYCHGAASNNSSDFPIACEECHFHGSYVDEYDKYTPEGIARGVKYVKPTFKPFRRKTF